MGSVRLLVLWALLVPSTLLAAQPPADRSVAGVVARDDELRAEAADDATAIQKVGKGTAVRVLFREGAWYRVAHGDQQGWLRLVWVRTGGAVVARGAAPAPARTIGQSLAAARSRRNQGQVAATLGVRGLSEDELQGASFDAAQIERLEKLRADNGSAQRFAAAGALRARTVDELANAANSRSRASGRNNGRNRR